LQILIKKIKIKFPAVTVSNLGYQTLDADPGAGSDLEKMLDPDPYPDPHLMNADPQPCFSSSSRQTVLVIEHGDGHWIFLCLFFRNEC
jgi:hypothetical protein